LFIFLGLAQSKNKLKDADKSSHILLGRAGLEPELDSAQLKIVYDNYELMHSTLNCIQAHNLVE
jgi:hypothetical protein